MSVSCKLSHKGLERLKKALSDKRMSKQELADKAKVARSTVSNLFLGRSVLSEKLESICSVLNIPPEEIISDNTTTDDVNTELNCDTKNTQALVNNVRNRLFSNSEPPEVIRSLDMPKPIDINDIYVETKVWNDLNYDRRKEKNNSDELARVNGSKIQGIDAIRLNSKLLILGKPGAGKTTFLKYIAQNNELSLELDVVPILIKLRDYAYRHIEKPQLDAYIKDILDQQKNITESETQTILNQGKGLILLDALDEVPISQDNSICREIIDFIAKYRKNRFVITCRNASEPFKLEDFVRVQITDFDGDQAKQFVEKWFKGDETLFPYNQESLKLAKEKLTRQIEAQSVSNELKINRHRIDDLRSIKELTKTPLLLTMLCHVVAQEGEIPRGRLDLYKKSVDIMLKEWDAERGISRERLDGLTTEKIKVLLSKIAIQAHSKHAPVISEWEIESIILQEHQEYEPKLDPLEFLKLIESQCGILISSDLGKYAFRHQTFQEYFTALSIIELIDDSAKLSDYLTSERIADPSWLEVFVLVAEFLCHKMEAKKLISDFLHIILQHIIYILNDSSKNQLLLNEFIEEIKKIEKGISETIRNNHKTRTNNEEKFIDSAALRIFLSDPDYEYDSTRTLLLELDKQFGNVLVASSFIIRLFWDEVNDKNIEIPEAIMIAMQVPNIRDAVNADHALEIVYKYTKDEYFKIERVASPKSYIKLRSKAIENELEYIYTDDHLSLAEKAEKCRTLCLKNLDLSETLNVSNKLIGLPSYPQLYNATLLLTRSMNVIEYLLPNLDLGCDLQNLIMTTSDELEKECNLMKNNKFNNQLNEGEYRFSGQLSDEYALWQSARPYVDGLRKQLIDFLRESEQSQNAIPRILELGCGDGELTKLVLDYRKASIVAVDNEPLMIQKIKQRFNQFQDNEILLIVQADILSFLKMCSSESFDFIISGFTLHNILAPCRFDVLKEVYRVLRSGGKLLDADKIAQRGESHAQARERQINKFIEVLVSAKRLDLLEKTILHYMIDDEPDRIRYEDEAIAELLKIGFKDVKLSNRQDMDAIIVALK
jgi:tRNA (cmo5U34)-methyltransferase